MTPERVAGAGALGRERPEQRGHAVLILGLLGQDRASDRYWDGALADERDRHRWERTPWHATQRAAWEALKKGGRANDEAIFIMAPHRAPN